MCQPATGLTGNMTSHFGRAGEGDLVDVRVLDQCFTGHPAGSGEDVEHTGRQVFGADLGEQQHAQRSRLGRLDHDGVSRDEGGGDLESGDHQRGVPGQDASDDAEGSWREYWS